MIKSHKPRGHYWTHASAFQQTEENRNIRYDDCTPSDVEVLVPDSDDEQSPTTRGSKRRRIEKLADDFLNGERLVIPSLPLCPNSVYSTTYRQGKGVNREDRRQAEAHTTESSTQIWKDMETDEEILARLVRDLGSSRHRSDGTNTNADSNDGILAASNVQAQASCAPSTTTRLHRLTLGPSEEALRQAAALRDRRTQKSKSELPVVRTAPSRNQGFEQVESRPRSDSYVGIEESQLAHLPNDWLSRRKSRFSFAQRDKDEDEGSGDELRLSNKTPSQRRRGRTRSLQRPKQYQSPRQSSDTPYSIVNDNGPSNQAARPSEQSEPQASYCTAPEPTEPENRINVAQSDPQDGEQNRQVRSQDRGATRKLWSAMNESFGSVAQALTAEATSSTSAPASTLRSSIHNSIKAAAAKPTKGNRTKVSASSTPQPIRRSARIRSAPTTVSQVPTSGELPQIHKQRKNGLKTYGKRSRYPNVQSTQNGTSPFVWRRLSSESLIGEEQTAVPTEKEQITMRRPVKFASSDNIKVADRRSSVPSQQQSDTSFRTGSISLEGSHVALTDEHWMPAQTRMTALDSQFWPGTQAALEQAENNLFTSPEKRDATVERDHDPTIDPPGIVPPSSQGRVPLKQLSQEPMPSTQALIDNFAGFSTVKKPNVAYRESPSYTPTAIGKGARKDNVTRSSLKLPSTAPQTCVAQSSSTRRSSALRQSVTAIESPMYMTGSGISPSITPATATMGVLINDGIAPKSILKSSVTLNRPTTSSLAVLSAPTPPGDVSSFQSFTSGPELSSFQAAQPRSGLPREESSLGRTIDELTRDVLSMADMHGVLSQ